MRYNRVELRHASRHHSRPLRPHIGVLVGADSSYGRSILQGVARHANLQRNWLISRDLNKIMEFQREWPHFDGMIFAGVHTHVFNRGVEHCKNVVRCSGAGDPAVSCVVALDDEAAGAQAAEHLMDCRFDKFAYYGVEPTFLTTVKRFEGFRQALAKRGFTCLECPVPHMSLEELYTHSHRPALIRWLKEIPRPIGIMAFDDGDANDLAETCMEAGIAVPEQVAIVGTNNDELLCEMAWPPLSSVIGDYSRLGYAAAKLIDRMLSGEVLPPEDRRVLLPPLGVFQRHSTDVLAIKDPNIASAIRFIREHACDPCSVHDVLRAVPVGRRWLERQCVAHLGRTPHEEIIRVRVDTACRLLLNSDLTREEIAARCGYSGTKNFHTAFRDSTGTTPAAFRKDAKIAAS